MKVLLVDDSEITLDIMRDVLAELGCQTTALASPYGMPFVATREAPDLILVDLKMAAMNGEDVVKRLRKTAASERTRILLFSDSAREEVERAVQRCGADGFLLKAPPDELLTKLRPIVASIASSSSS